MAHIRTYRTPVKMGNWFEEQRLKEVCLKRERERKKLLEHLMFQPAMG